MAKRDPKDAFDTKPQTTGSNPVVPRPGGKRVTKEVFVAESAEERAKRLDLGGNAAPVLNPQRAGIAPLKSSSSKETAPDLEAVEDEPVLDARELLRRMPEPELPDAMNQAPSSSTMIIEGSSDDLPPVASETVVRAPPTSRPSKVQPLPPERQGLPPAVIPGLVAFVAVICLGILFKVASRPVADPEPTPVVAAPGKKSDPVAAAPSAPGTVKIISTPPAELFVGTQSYGITPATVTAPAGKLAIVLRDVALALRFSTEVDIAAGRETIASLTVAHGTVDTIAPEGTHFVVDGKPNNVRPMQLWPGPHIIEAVLPSGEHVTQPAEVAPNTVTSVEFVRPR